MDHAARWTTHWTTRWTADWTARGGRVRFEGEVYKVVTEELARKLHAHPALHHVHARAGRAWVLVRYLCALRMRVR